MSIMEHKNLIIFIIAAAAIITIVYFAAQELSLNGERKEEMTPLGDDTSVSAIEKDLAGTEITDLDKEFTDIDAELETAINEAQ